MTTDAKISRPRVRVYMGCSFDGFIAGPKNELDWLTQDHGRPGDLLPSGGALSFEVFMSQAGAILMGRNTYEVVEKTGQWMYGEIPVLVATTRPIDPILPTVHASSGNIAELISKAKSLAGDKDVYLDGGSLVQQALNAKLVDEITATFLPLLLGRGIRLFDELIGRTSLQFTGHHMHEGGMLQVSARVVQGSP